MTMARIFVCSQLRATDTRTEEEHISDTQQYCRHVSNENYGAAFAPHLLYTQFLDDNEPAERELGINSGIAFMNVCNACFVYINSTGTVSEGMKHEIRYALGHGIPVRVFEVRYGETCEVKGRVEQWRKDGI